MFTVGAFCAVALFGWWALQGTKKERESVSERDVVDQGIMFIRQDVQLIAFLLAGILIMLGIIADKLKLGRGGDAHFQWLFLRRSQNEVLAFSS
jgi:hypothetical protein